MNKYILSELKHFELPTSLNRIIDIIIDEKLTFKIRKIENNLIKLSLCEESQQIITGIVKNDVNSLIVTQTLLYLRLSDKLKKYKVK